MQTFDKDPNKYIKGKKSVDETTSDASDVKHGSVVARPASTPAGATAIDS